MWRHCLFVAQLSHMYETVASHEGQDLAFEAIIAIAGVHCLVTLNCPRHTVECTLSHLANHEVFKKLLSHFPIGSRRTKEVKFVVNHFYMLLQWSQLILSIRVITHKLPPSARFGCFWVPCPNSKLLSTDFLITSHHYFLVLLNYDHPIFSFVIESTTPSHHAKYVLSSSLLTYSKHTSILKPTSDASTFGMIFGCNLDWRSVSFSCSLLSLSSMASFAKSSLLLVLMLSSTNWRSDIVPQVCNWLTQTLHNSLPAHLECHAFFQL